MDEELAVEVETSQFEDEGSIIEFEYIFNDELEELARDRDLDDILGLYDSESTDFV
jgi:hypothetical protein